MKITSDSSGINPSKIHEASPKKYLYKLIKKISKCAFATLFVLGTITTLISEAIAYPRVAIEPATTTRRFIPDDVKIIYIGPPTRKVDTWFHNVGPMG